MPIQFGFSQLFLQMTSGRWMRLDVRIQNLAKWKWSITPWKWIARLQLPDYIILERDVVILLTSIPTICWVLCWIWGGYWLHVWLAMLETMSPLWGLNHFFHLLKCWPCLCSSPSMLDKLRQVRGQLVWGRDFPHQRYQPERNTKGHSTVPSFVCRIVGESL